jgi:hypothetical protein
VSGHEEDPNSPSGTHESAPLMIGIVGISIPVTLAAVAAMSGSTAVLVLAVIAMLIVGTLALLFMMRLMTDPPESGSGAGHGE